MDRPTVHVWEVGAPSVFWVHEMSRGGESGVLIATHKTRAAAIEHARAYAIEHDCYLLSADVLPFRRPNG